MELQRDLCDYLKTKSLISEYDIKAQTEEKATLENEASLALELGIKLPGLITGLYQIKARKDPSVQVPSLDSLKESQTPAARLYNWNLILKALVPLGVKLEEDLKSLIVAGDHQIICDLIRSIKECEEKMILEGDEEESGEGGDKKSMQSSQRLHQPTGQRMKAGAANTGKIKLLLQLEKAAIDITSVSLKKDLTTIDNCLEFLLVTISKAFSLQPKQAAGLLTEGSKYLSHILIKGIKSDFQPVISWLMEVYAASKHFSNLIKMEDPGNSIKMVLNSLKGGLYSKSKEVIMWTLKVLSKMIYDFSNLELSKESWDWFISIDGGLEGSVYCLKKHSEIIPNVLELMIHVGKDNINELFTHYLKNFINDNVLYWRTIASFIQPISNIQSSLDEELQGSIKSLLEYFLDSACRLADNDGRHTVDERAVALNVLCELWIYFPGFMDAKDEVANSILTVLKRASRDKAAGLQFFSIAQLFYLLHCFAENKRPHAPTIYKALAFSLVENHQNSPVRGYIMQNFVKVFSEIPAIPISILIDPLVKQIQISEGLTFTYDITDFEFFSFIAQHSKLTVKSAVQLMDILAKIIINDSIFGRMAKSTMILLIKKFISDTMIQEFIQKFIKVALASILSQAKKASARKAKAAGNKRYPNYQAMKEAKEMEKEAEVFGGFTTHFLSDCIVEITPDLDQQSLLLLHESAIHSHQVIKQITHKNYEPIMEILKYFGDPLQQIDIFEKEEEEKLEQERKLKEAQEEEERKRLAIEAPPPPSGGTVEGNAGKGRSTIMTEQLEGALVSQKSGKGIGTPSANSKQLIPYRSSGALGQKAMLWIDRIKKQKVDKEEQKKMNEDKLRLKQEKEKKILKQQIERRNLELGVGSKVQPEVQGGQLILKEGMLEKMQSVKQKGPKVMIINFDEEEEREKLPFEISLKKYRKLFKFLFDKYSNTTVVKKVKVFDALKERADAMTLGEFIKMLKDHKIESNMISREELTEIVNIMKANSITRAETASEHLSLNSQQFIDVLVQVSLNIFGKPFKQLSYFPYVFSFEELMKLFQKAFVARGEKTLLFTDPDAASLMPEDQKLLKELNSNPTLPLPSNFKRVAEKQVKFVNSISSHLPIKESQKISCEIIDDILFKNFETHFVECISKVDQKTRVIPEGIKKAKGREESAGGGPRYLEPIERRVKSPPQQPGELAITKQMPIPGVKASEKVKPRLSASMKLILAKVPKAMQAIATNDIAPLMEEILKAVEEERTSLAITKPINKAEQKRKQAEEEFKKRELENEKKRQQRHTQLKKELEDKKKKTKEQEEAKKKENEEKEKAEKEKQEQEKLNKKKEREEAKQKLKEMKEKKEAEKKAKEEEEMKKKKELNEIKAKEREAFIKKQNEELDKLNKDKMEKRKKEKEEEERKEKEAAEKRQRDLKKLEEQLKVDKQIMQINKRQIEELKQFCDSPAASAVITKYGKHLKYLFDFYSKLEDVEIDIKLLLSTTTIQQHTFIKFAQQFNFVPHLLTSEDVNYIYKILIKDKIAAGQDQMRTLNYEDFLEALVRITIVGVKKLRQISGYPAPIEEKKESEVMSEAKSISKKQKKILNFDVKTINVDDFENLLKYMKLAPDMKKTALMQRLNDLQHDKKKGKKDKEDESKTENAATQIDFLKESEKQGENTGGVGTEVKDEKKEEKKEEMKKAAESEKKQ